MRIVSGTTQTPVRTASASASRVRWRRSQTRASDIKLENVSANDISGGLRAFCSRFLRRHIRSGWRKLLHHGKSKRFSFGAVEELIEHSAQGIGRELFHEHAALSD